MRKNEAEVQSTWNQPLVVADNRLDLNMGGPPKIGGFNPKMDGENNGKPYVQMDDLGVNTPIFGNTHIFPQKEICKDIVRISV